MLQEKYRLDMMSILSVSRIWFTVGSLEDVTAEQRGGGHAVQYMVHGIRRARVCLVPIA